MCFNFTWLMRYAYRYVFQKKISIHMVDDVCIQVCDSKKNFQFTWLMRYAYRYVFQKKFSIHMVDEVCIQVCDSKKNFQFTWLMRYAYRYVFQKKFSIHMVDEVCIHIQGSSENPCAAPRFQGVTKVWVLPPKNHMVQNRSLIYPPNTHGPHISGCCPKKSQSENLQSSRIVPT